MLEKSGKILEGTFRWAGLVAVLLAFSAMPISAQTGEGRTSVSSASAESIINDTQVSVKVVAVKDNAVSPNEYNVPAAGKKFVSLQIVVDNKGKDEWYLLHTCFVLKDAEGNVYDINNYVLLSNGVTEPTLKSGVVDGGDLVKGWVTYQVGSSVNVRSLKLRYEHAFASQPMIKSGWIPLAAVLK